MSSLNDPHPLSPKLQALELDQETDLEDFQQLRTAFHDWILISKERHELCGDAHDTPDGVNTKVLSMTVFDEKAGNTSESSPILFERKDMNICFNRMSRDCEDGTSDVVSPNAKQPQILLTSKQPQSPVILFTVEELYLKDNFNKKKANVPFTRSSHDFRDCSLYTGRSKLNHGLALFSRVPLLRRPALKILAKKVENARKSLK